MDVLRNLRYILLEFIFPRKETVRSLEAQSPSSLLARLPEAKSPEDDTIALFDYQNGDVRELIWELKYHGNVILAEKLGVILYDVITHEVAERALLENFIGTAEAPILLIPMPASRERKLERGYNQAEMLCKAIKARDTVHLLDLHEDILIKKKHTESQTKVVSRKHRLQNILGSMEVQPMHNVLGRAIILIDDVTTTGATFKEAKRALLEAGARKVLCIAVAH